MPLQMRRRKGIPGVGTRDTAVSEGGTGRAHPTVSGFAANCAIAALRKHTVAARPLLHRAGLSGFNFDDPLVRVPAASEVKFLEYAAEATNDSAFVLHLAEQANPREAGLLFYVVSATRNLGEAMALFARFIRLVNESARVKISKRTDSVIVEIGFVGIRRHRAKQLMEFEAALAVNVMREITGRDIRPIRVAFAHARNGDLREFERFYGCPVEFGAPSVQLEFSNETLALPLVTEDPHLLETLQPFCEEAARARNAPACSLRTSVENEVERLLPQRQANARTVAKALALSVRTLSRRLSEEGTTFAAVVEQLRRSLALQYLKDPGFSLAQIAWLLGYEGATSFNHAFKRWTGRSPSATRNEKPHFDPVYRIG
jgi:AraC-like DNA-binding protein